MWILEGTKGRQRKSLEALLQRLDSHQADFMDINHARKKVKACLNGASLEEIGVYIRRVGNRKTKTPIDDLLKRRFGLGEDIPDAGDFLLAHLDDQRRKQYKARERAIRAWMRDNPERVAEIASKGG